MQYTIYGGELSLFTRKLEAAMIFYGANFEVVPKGPDNAQLLEARSGTHQVPILHTPENWMIADTTPLLAMLDARFPKRTLFPSAELGVLTHVIEDNMDEWVARVMVHYRWHYPDSARFAAQKIALGNQAAAERIVEWGPRACRATGTDSQHQREAVEAEYHRLLSAAEAQLKRTRYLLGDRPTAVDCIVLGGLRAHTDMDPDPKKVTAQFPTVLEWSRNRADQWDGTGELAPFPDSTDFAQHVLSEMSSTYSPFMLGNRDALAAGAKAFHVETYGEAVSYLTRPYPELARNMVIERISNLRSDPVDSWLRQHGLANTFG